LHLAAGTAFKLFECTVEHLFSIILDLLAFAPKLPNRSQSLFKDRFCYNKH